jgi:outer membrane protein insertion porin family
VIRRELRQMEGSWYSLEKIARSKERLQRTGFFTEVKIDTPAVPGTSDQVDVNVTVVERNTGQLSFGVGYSAIEKVQIQASLSQSNFMGTGNLMQMVASTGAVNRDISLSYMNPYWTADGISRAFDVYQRNVDTAGLLGLATYSTYTTGAGVRFGIPVTEYDTVGGGLALERTRLTIDPTVPQRYLDFVNEFGERTITLRTNWSYAHDTRDSIIWPTSGTYNEISAEVGIPPGDLTYYRTNYTSQAFYTPPWLSWLTMSAKAQLGYANGYRGHALPFFKNFYAGGVDSVRAFETATLGPRDTNGDILGGNRSFVSNLEALFPIPGYREKNVRLSQFIDFGDVWGPDERVRAIDLRVSTGLGVNWDSPMGPLRFSFGIPLKKRQDDKIERFQFQLGRTF